MQIIKKSSEKFTTFFAIPYSHKHNTKESSSCVPLKLEILAEVTPSISSMFTLDEIKCYSHSIVAGGLVVTSYTTLLTPSTSLVILFDTFSSTS